MKAVFLAPASLVREAGAFDWIFEKFDPKRGTGKKPDVANVGVAPKIPNPKSKI
ncbi:hypothetical protein QUB10_17955 [Microcoleus sp. B5-D4]|uniref:hypothetical protein n=1 Tax=unclassified Microcoleus TaxID=2642155 RepID=UPI002FD459A5